MSDFGTDLIAAMEEAATHAKGNGGVARVHTIATIEVRAATGKFGPLPKFVPGKGR